MKQKTFRSLLSTALSVAAVFVFAISIAAQGGPVPTPEHPPMAAQQFDRDKETLYAYFSENKNGLTPDHQNRAYAAAKAFVRRYGGDNDNYAKEVKKFVADYEKSAYGYEAYTAYIAKNYSASFELGRPVLKKEPNNFFVLGVLAEAGYENALAKNTSLNDETIGYVQRAIKLLEDGKVAKPDPFKDLNAAHGFLNLALGWFLKDRSPGEAANAFQKALKPKSPYENDPITNYRLGLAILKGEFAELSAEYNKTFGSQPPSPEQQKMLKRVQVLGARAVDAYARAVALSDPKHSAPGLNPDFHNQVFNQLTTLYKSLFNSDAGLDEYVATVLTKPRP